MCDWQSIETAVGWLRGRGLSSLLEKSADVSTWGHVLILCPKDQSRSGEHIFVGKFIDWGEGNRNSHWRDANSWDEENLKPSHWMPIPAVP